MSAENPRVSTKAFMVAAAIGSSVAMPNCLALITGIGFTQRGLIDRWRLHWGRRWWWWGIRTLTGEEVAVHQRQGRVAEEERQDHPVAPQAPRRSGRLGWLGRLSGRSSRLSWLGRFSTRLSRLSRLSWLGRLSWLSWLSWLVSRWFVSRWFVSWRRGFRWWRSNFSNRNNRCGDLSH